MDFEGIMPENEISDTEKDKYCLILLICVCVCVCVCELFSHVWLFATLWTVAHQDPLSMGFSRLEYQSGLPSFLQGSSWPRDCTLVSCMWNLKNATN